MQTRQQFKILLLILIAFILATICYTVMSNHYHVKSSLITGLTNVEERHYYTVHGWEDFAPMKSTVKAKKIIYNRVGKCGSRTMVQLMITLARKQKYTVIGSTNNGRLQRNLREQVEVVDFIDHLQAPFIYHEHVHFIDFKRFGAVQPIYINVIRDPLARLVSSYYFKRFGDNRDGRSWSFKGTEEQKNMFILVKTFASVYHIDTWKFSTDPPSPAIGLQA